MFDIDPSALAMLRAFARARKANNARADTYSDAFQVWVDAGYPIEATTPDVLAEVHRLAAALAAAEQERVNASAALSYASATCEHNRERLIPALDAAAARLDRAASIAKLALQYARIERVTRHEDGIRPETDSDHVVMLALVACDLAPDGLNRGRIAQFAVVHDLVEAYAGDVQTLVITIQGRRDKEARERAAADRIRAEFGAGSWIVQTLSAYEAQVEHEARYVRCMDKVVPKLTHLFNGCIAAKVLTDRAGFVASHEEQHRKLTGEYGGEWWARDVLDLLRDAMLASEAAWTP